MKKLVYLVSFSLFLLSTMLIPHSKVMADSSTPDSVTIDNAYGFRHVLEDEDNLYIVQYTIDWTTGTPPGYIGDEYLGQFLDDTEIFASTQPWGYVSAGADTVSWWFAVYLSAADVVSHGIFYSDPNNKVALTGNPALVWDGGVPYVESSAITYDDSTTQAESQIALEQRFRLMGLYYEQLSGGTLDLLEDVGGVLKLTSTGETYFTSTLASIRSMAPGLFADSITAATFDLSEVIDDYNVFSDEDTHVFGTDWVAQTFTTDFSYAISGAQVKVFRVGNPGDVTLSLRATTGSTPSGIDLAEGTVDGDDFSDYTTGEWETITFDSDYTLTGGTSYALVMRAIAGNINNYVGWRDHTGDWFTSGTMSGSGDSGVTWTVANQDQAFACISKDAETGAYGQRGQARLEDSPFDMTDLAADMGLSTLWMSTLVWLIITGCMCFAAIKVTNSNQPVWSVFILMSPIGWYTGFLAPAIAIGIAAVCAIGFVYQLFFKPSGI